MMQMEIDMQMNEKILIKLQYIIIIVDEEKQQKLKAENI
jgi:hypothetical protein